MKFGAIHAAAITPHREVAYEADLGATLELVDYLCAAHVHGIALLGSAGEFLSTGCFAGIKDSSGDFDQFLKFKALRDSVPFTFLAGNDVIFTRARGAGADGGISGVACAIPELMLGLENAIQSGDQVQVQRLEGRLQEFIAWLDRFPAPVGIKAATAARGLKVGPLAVPLSPEKQRELDEFRDWFKAWL